MARRCPACNRELVQREGEDAYHFGMRKTCDRKCFAKWAQHNGRRRVDERGERERAEVERRTEEVRQALRAKWLADGCKLTDSLD